MQVRGVRRTRKVHGAFESGVSAVLAVLPADGRSGPVGVGCDTGVDGEVAGVVEAVDVGDLHQHGDGGAGCDAWHGGEDGTGGVSAQFARELGLEAARASGPGEAAAPASAARSLPSRHPAR